MSNFSRAPFHGSFKGPFKTPTASQSVPPVASKLDDREPADILDLDDPSTTDAATTAADRRRSERVAAEVPGWVSGESIDRAARGHDVTIIDLSMHGVGFRDDQPYRVGACHWLVVNGGAMRMSTRIKIVSSRQNDDGQYEIGAKFF